MQVGLSLIVKLLGLDRGRGYRLVENTDPISQRHWALHDFVWHIADAIVIVSVIHLSGGGKRSSR